MRFHRSKEWWMERAHREGDTPMGAGLLARDPASGARHPSTSVAPVEETRIAFGIFVTLMRRELGYSIEDLAVTAELEPSELLVIEDDVHHVPEPRTVYKLAQVFKVSQQRLMQLSGLAIATDVGLRREAVRFAARSESVEKLTPEQSSALAAFVSVLSDKCEPRSGQ